MSITSSTSLRLKLGVSVAALAFASVAFAQAPAAKPARIRGDIVSLSGDTLTVHRRSGDTVTIDMKQDTPVTAVKNIKLSDIKTGSFIGTAATTGTDGKMTATEVLVFPEAARGSGEGHYAWDLALNPLGARGIGEIGMAGIAPAITNAVYHATGMRVRKLPVRIEDLLAAPGSA